MKKIGLGILGCIILIGLLVLLYIKQTTVDTCTKGCLPNNMENKTDDLQGVKSICEDNGGIIQPYDDEGGNFSLCLFDDGSFCESWELYRGECGKGDKQFEDFLEAMSGSEGITAGEEQNESFYDGMRIKCIESGYNWVQGDCMSGENIIEIIDSDPYVDDYFDGFTGNIINGSDGKSYVITGDNTLYYNDNYGFAIKLGKEWKNSLIVQEKNEHALGTSYSNYSINFKKYSPFLDDYETIIGLSLFPFELYEIYLDMVDNDVYESREDIYKRVIGKNNKYVFIINTINVGHEGINGIFPNLCNEETTKDNLKRRECGNRLNKIFTGYLITDL